MRILILTFLLFVSGYSLKLNRNYGESSFQFLKLNLTANSVAMSGSGVSLPAGASGMDINPAATADQPVSLVLGWGYPHAEFGARTGLIAWSVPVKGMRYLLNVRHLDFGNGGRIRGFDYDANSTLPYSANTFQFKTGASGILNSVSWGGTVAYAQNHIAHGNYSTLIGNLGLRWEFSDGIYIGASGTNLEIWTSEAKIAGNSRPFPPTTFQAGAAWQWNRDDLGLIASLDARTRNDEEMSVPVGFEISWSETLYGRGGYVFLEQLREFSLGMGLRWDAFTLDYAWQYHQVLSSGHYWTLSVHY